VLGHDGLVSDAAIRDQIATALRILAGYAGAGAEGESTGRLAEVFRWAGVLVT